MNPIDMLLQENYDAFGEWVEENDTGADQALADIAQQIDGEVEAQHLAQEAMKLNANANDGPDIYAHHKLS
ncbi:hypothetical protein V5O48_010484 [Marasmius crinis-equi]|uniref:Uncharacterized protein n=1 Tax=Marasmius crinis-equi TaxID=585013 RepID=A0ABR3F889_9AGAR